MWLARHGEVHNPAEILYGRLPRMRLSLEGQRQADAVADFLQSQPLAAVYSSPMLRARRTAAACLARHPNLHRVRIDRDLQEIRTGWQGEHTTALASINWDFYANPRHPEDETLQGIHARMCRWLGRMLRRHAGQEVLGVSHGDPILVLVGSLQGLPLDSQRIFPKPYIETATVFRLDFDAAGRCQQIDKHVPHAAVAA